MSIDPARLATLPLFGDVSPPALAALARRGVEAKFAAGSVIFLTGDEPRGWYVVLEGCVRIVHGSGSRQHVVHTETVGGTMGEVPVFGGSTHPATGIAAEPTRCAIFDRATLEAVIAEYSEFGLLINRRLALRVRRLVERLDERSRTVRSRLAEFLLDRVATSQTGDRFSAGMTQQALAEELGTVREVISREIKSLVADGVIEPLGGGRYRMTDAARLRERASEDR